MVSVAYGEERGGGQTGAESKYISGPDARQDFSGKHKRTHRKPCALVSDRGLAHMALPASNIHICSLEYWAVAGGLRIPTVNLLIPPLHNLNTRSL